MLLPLKSDSLTYASTFISAVHASSCDGTPWLRIFVIRTTCCPTHIPLLTPQISHILFTGNLVDRTVLDYLRSLANEVHIVRGDFDDVLHLPGVVEALPDNLTITIGEFKIGLIHGHQLVPWGDAESLAAAQRALDADILISGHTHRFATYAYDGALFVNPGSATGAFTVSSPCRELAAIGRTLLKCAAHHVLELT